MGQWARTRGGVLVPQRIDSNWKSDMPSGALTIVQKRVAEKLITLKLGSPRLLM